MLHNPNNSPQFSSQLTNQIDGITALCLFSLICFGQKHEGDVYKLGPGTCRGYKNINGLNSFICSADIDTTSFDDSGLHTLAISGSDLHLSESDLCNLNYKHLILKELTFTKTASHCDCVRNCKVKHQSVTIFNCKNANKWTWSYLHFDHLHIERSDLSSNYALPGPTLPKQLKSLSYIACLIKLIPKDHFSNLKALEMVTISKNSLKSLSMNSFPSSGLPLLWLLDLSYNQLSHIDASLTSYFPSLIEINLKSNHIQTLGLNLFSSVWPRISVLDISSNALICDRLCWTTESTSRPHPIFFDDTNCYVENFDNFTIGSLGSIDNPLIDC